MKIHEIINERFSRFSFHQKRGKLNVNYKLKFLKIIHFDFYK